ncbi:MAG TPA: helix-turn-helix transcriptional regulator [Anaerovoracaceae bacterium]|nr:helix-turn-helix transcriptional regulator [Anaerovoracaceae bacterium]HZX21300.1 helix-turn-helix transcriptional regulator [Clostridia bacterium]
MNVNYVRSLRSYKNLTQAEMAKILNLSITSYNKKETNKVPFTLDEVKTLSEYFGVAIENFFKDEVFNLNTGS